MNIEMEPMAAVALVLLLFVVFAAMFSSNEKPAKDQDEKDRITLEALSGKTPIEEIAEREGVTVDEINAWKEEFINNGMQYSKNRKYLEQQQFQYERDIKWFEETCEKFIGSDWKEKTDYENRNR